MTILNTRMLIATLALAALIIAFVFSYVAVEHPAYYWDWGQYFGLYRQHAALLLASPADFIARTWLSIRFEDYNLAAVLPLMPVHLLLGDTRFGFILGLVLLYLVPASLISTRLSLLSAGDDHDTSLVRWTLAIATLLFVPYWQATLRGLPDIAGLIPLGLATILILRSDFLTTRRVQSAILLGLLLWLTFLLRRWYAYACLALLLTTFAMMIAQGLHRREALGALAIRVLVPALITGAVCANLLMLFQGPLVLRILGTSYADVYAGYQLPPLEQILLYYHHVGPVYSLLFATGLVLAIRRRHLPVLLLGGTALLTAILFGLTQAPSTQHGLPVYLWCLPAVMLAVKAFITAWPRWRTARALGLLALFATIFAGSLVPVTSTWPIVQQLSAETRYFPLHLNRLSEYQRLTADLQRIGETGATVTVLASGHTLSDSLLASIDPALAPHVIAAAHVDERDGFWIEALRADYAVVANPVPIHLRPGSQTVITIPAEQILQGRGLGDGYQPAMGPYQLDGNLTAWVYRRIRPLTPDDITLLTDLLARGHPAWRWDGSDRIGPFSAE